MCNGAGNNIGDEGVAGLAEGLRSNSTLVSLNLKRESIPLIRICSLRPDVLYDFLAVFGTDEKMFTTSRLHPLYS